MNSFGLEISFAMVEAARKRVFALGRLMSPEETSYALRERSKFEQENIKGWQICGDMHPDMWERTLSRQGAMTTNLQLLEHRDGSRQGFALLYQEIDSWQHRFVVPLVGSSARKFVESLSKAPLSVSLSSDAYGNAMVRPVSVTNEARKEMQRICTDEWTDPVKQFEDAAFLAMLMTSPDAVPPIAATKIGQVCVTLVVPPEIGALSERMDQSDLA